MMCELKAKASIGNLALMLALLPFLAESSSVQSYAQTSLINNEVLEHDIINVSSPKIINQFWTRITGAELGSMVGIQSDVMNYSPSEKTFTFIVQIKDEKGITMDLTILQDLTASPNHSLKPAVFWLPEKDGDYHAEIFVWQSVNEPVPLAPVNTVNFSVY